MNDVLLKSRKLFGVTLYKKYRTGNSLIRSFLAETYKRVTTFEHYGAPSSQVYLFGLPLCGKRSSDSFITWHLGSSLTISRKSIAKELSKNLSKIFEKKRVRPVNGRKHVFIFSGNSGEIATLLMYFLEPLCANLCLDMHEEIVFLCTKPYHKDMLLFYFPQVQCEVKHPQILQYVQGDMDAYPWHVHMCFPKKYFVQFENNVEPQTVNFIDWMSHWLSLPITAAKVPNQERLRGAYNSALKHLTLQQRNSIEGRESKGLVILIPRASSCLSLPDEIIQKAITDYTKQGYTIYLNTDNPKDPGYLTYPEFYAIAKRAKRVITIRNGLVDFISNTGTPLAIYYTQFPKRDFVFTEKKSERVYQLFSLKNHHTSVADIAKETTVTS